MNVNELIDAMGSINPAARCKELEVQLDAMAARAEAAEKECERLRSDMARVRLEARRLLGGSEQWAEIARRARDLEHQLNALEPATPNHDRSQLEALGQIRLVWVEGQGDYAAILKHGDLEVGEVLKMGNDAFMPFRWVSAPEGYGYWGAIAQTKTLEEAKALCEKYVRNELEGK